MNITIRIFILSLLLISGCSKVISSDKNQTPFLKVSNLSGEEINLYKYQKKITLVHFWATWCFMCKPEMESLNLLYKKIKDEDIEIIGIATSDDLSAVNSYVEQKKISFPVVYDPNAEIMQKFSVDTLPSTIILNKSGSVVSFIHPTTHESVNRIVGPLGWESRNVLEKLLEILKANE